MSYQLLKSSLLTFALLVIITTATNVYAETKTLLVAFDRNLLCCLMNHMRLEELLTDIDGIEGADFRQRKREILVSYDTSKIAVPAIVDHVVRITGVDKEIILLPDSE